MIALLLILFFVFQGAASSPKWDCAKNCEPPDKNVTRLKGREMLERVVSCETPKLPNLLDAKGTVLVEVFVNETGDVSCFIQGEGVEAEVRRMYPNHEIATITAGVVRESGYAIERRPVGIPMKVIGVPG